MLPVLFHLTIPAGLGKPLVVVAALVLVLGRAVAYWRTARKGRAPVSFAGTLWADRWFAGGLALVAIALLRGGLLDRTVSLPLHSYGLLIAAGFMVGIALARREAIRVGQDPERISDLAFWVLVAALVGSRVYFIAVNLHDYTGDGFWLETAIGRIPRVLAIWEGGLVFYGGFIGAALAAAYYMRRHRMPFLAYADTIIPSVAIGHFFGRLGCFCAGCCWGAIGHGEWPWLVSWPRFSQPWSSFAGRPDAADLLTADRSHTLPLHPTQLYESFGELGLFLLLALVIRPRKRFHGQVLASWLMLYAVLRTAIEAFRGDVERGVVAGLGVGAWTSLVIFATGAVIWARARRRAAVDGAPPDAAAAA